MNRPPQQYNVGLQYQIKSWLIDAGYVGSHSLKQPINLSMTQMDPRYMPLGNDLRRQVPNPFLGLVTAGSYANPTVANGDLLKPFPRFASVTNIFASIGNSNFQSLQARLERRFARGYSILAVYTWGKNLGNVGERYHVGNSIQNNYDLRSERGLSPFDVAHRLVLSYLWELPFGKGKAIGGSLPKAADLLVSGWQVNGITTFQSGTPLSVGLSFPPWKFDVVGPSALLNLLAQRGAVCVLGSVDAQVFWELLAQLLDDSRYRPHDELFTPITSPTVFGHLYDVLSGLPIGESIDLADLAPLRPKDPTAEASRSNDGLTTVFRYVRVSRGATFSGMPASSTARRFSAMTEEVPPWLLTLLPV